MYSEDNGAISDDEPLEMGVDAFGKTCKVLRRRWTAYEERHLIDILEELVVDGQKSDNGFRTGYLKTCVEKMSDLIPGFVLTVDQVFNKIQSWKKAYAPMRAMASASGFGWNEDEQRATCEDPQVWAEYIRVNPKAAKLGRRPWPLYKSFLIIFGVDRATGTGSKGHKASLANQLQRLAEQKERDTKRRTLGLKTHVLKRMKTSEEDSNPNPFNGIDINAVPEQASEKKKHKTFVLTPRNVKRDSFPNKEMDAYVQAFLESSQGQLEKFGAQVLGSTTQQENSSGNSTSPESKIERVVQLVKEIMTDRPDRVRITNRIVDNPRSTDLFLAISDEDRRTYILEMTQGLI